MKSTEASESRFLNAIGSHREEMIRFGISWRERREIVEAVTTGLDIRSYESGGTRMESHVEVVLIDRRCLTLWLELRLDGHDWMIEAALLEDGQEGQTTLFSFDRRFPLSIEKLENELEAATRELLLSAEGIAFG